MKKTATLILCVIALSLIFNISKVLISQETWTPTSTGANVPEARTNHTAVSIGSKMIVWGGSDNSNAFNTGGIYDPVTNSWTSTSTINVPTGRGFHTAIWTGTKMIIWGGQGQSGYTNTGVCTIP